MKLIKLGRVAHQDPSKIVNIQSTEHHKPTEKNKSWKISNEGGQRNVISFDFKREQDICSSIESIEGRNFILTF